VGLVGESKSYKAFFDALENVLLVYFHDIGYQTLTPEDYISYFKKKNVTCVVRLNKKIYDRRQFTDHGIRHVDLYFIDGGVPPPDILKKFLELAEGEKGALAVHCKAGLGRTGVLIGAYIMKHFGWTANEVMGYMRVCRPGSILGPQQNYLKDNEKAIWRMGELYRRRKVRVLTQEKHVRL